MLIDLPSLVLSSLVAVVPRDDLVLTVAVGVEASSSKISDGHSWVVEPSGLLEWLVSPWSNDSHDTVVVPVFVAVLDRKNSVVGSSDSSSSPVEGEPLSGVSRDRALDSHSVLTVSNVLSPEEGSVG